MSERHKEKKENILKLEFAMTKILPIDTEKEDILYICEEIEENLDFSEENIEETIRSAIDTFDLESQEIDFYVEDILEIVLMIKKGDFKIEEEKPEEAEFLRKERHGKCPICERTMQLTFHHLYPKETHKKLIKRKGMIKEDLLKNGINICRNCHSHVHNSISNEELSEKFHTLETILNHPSIKKFIPYIKKQRPHFTRM